MTLIEIYRLALIEGLTAKEAGEKYGVKPQSLLKKGSKHKMPSLKTEHLKKKENWLKSLTDEQLREYKKAIDHSDLFARRKPSEKEEILINLELIRREELRNTASGK
jgi:hypothetical protein